MFWLIDNILSCEACLYHQVVPLSLSDSSLHLGMVNLADPAAKDYVSRIVAYMNYTLVYQQISPSTHKALLSAYIKHQEISKQAVEHTIFHLASDSSTQPIALPTLEIQALHLASPVQMLATLPAKDLLQELLGRVLTEGIGRLYFERQYAEYGRVLWSQNGVVQSVLEEIPLAVFQQVIDELKTLMHLAIAPVSEQTQVEIERLYQDTRILLRLQIMPGTFGEEATLQVLRGAALKFYQQQQLTHLSRDALSIAQQLQHKLQELQLRANYHHCLNANQLEALPVLNQLLTSVNNQLEKLKHS